MKIRLINNHPIQFPKVLLVLSLLLFLMEIAPAQPVPFYWDAGNTNNGATIDAGSGAWDTDTTTNINWNDGSGNNVSWQQISTAASQNQAIFNGLDGADGAYLVNVDGGQVAVTNLFINSSGYYFYGSPIYIATQKGGNYPTIHVADGKSVTFSNLINGLNYTVQMTLGANGAPASVNFLGGLTGSQWMFGSTNGSVFYIGNNTTWRGIFAVNADVRMTNGVLSNVQAGSGAVLQIGRPGTVSSQPTCESGTLTIDGPTASVKLYGSSGDYLIVGRGIASTPPFTSTLTVQNGATLIDQVTAGNNGMVMPRIDAGGTNAISIFNVYDGTATFGNVGTVTTNDPIILQYGSSYPGQVSLVNQTGGVINAWSGIQFGGPGATRTGGSAILTNSGGFLYLGSSLNSDGLRAGANLPPTNVISFSGGTVGALQSWSGSALLPITLGTLNGNITFQCADSGLNPHDITLNGALIGPGGFNKTGAGQLMLNGINTYAGSTVVSDGVLQLTTAAIASSNGPVTLDGSAGSPDLRLVVSHQGQYWSIGTMTFASGSPILDFQFGVLVPSKTMASIQINGNLDFTATPAIIIDNSSALAVGTYPLIHYSGTSSGIAPTSVTLPGYCSGYVSNSAAAHTLYLVITSSTAPANLTWDTCSGNWDFTTSDWANNGVPATYSDNIAVVFDDTAPCTSPMATLNTTVSPSTVIFNNFTNSFAIIGNGNLAINASGDLELVGGGSVALATTNTYSGGTVVSDGSLLNINSGGSVSGSPIGTGTLTLNSTAQLGNSSGSAVTLQYPVPQVWNGNFSFAGSNDLNLGSGSVALTANTAINIVTNNLTIGGSISDSGSGKGLTKTGNGTLTLAANNSWNGLQLQAGQINFGSSGAAGSGSFTISAGEVDNVSGSDLALSASSYNINTSGGIFTIVGSGNLDFSSAPISASISGFTVNVISNTWITDCIGLNNAHATKTGNGTWRVVGMDSSILGPGNITVNQGVLDMARSGGTAVVGGGGGSGSYGGFPGLIVNSNALAIIDGFGTQISYTLPPAISSTPVEVVLNTGILDMNGYDLSVDLLALNNGILRNSAPGSFQVLNIETNRLILVGTNCQFDVPPSDASLYINAIASGSGALVKTGAGLLTMMLSNNYTGNITVNAGTLSLSYPDIAPAATVTIAGGTNAVLNLNFANSDTNMVSGLVLNGVSVAAGVHNAGTDPTYISGSGSLLVNPIIVNPLPGIIQFKMSGNTLSLAWPTNAGWLLQSQTNSLQAGLSTNWVTVPGSDSITNLSIQMSQTNGATFYRMVHP